MTGFLFTRPVQPTRTLSGEAALRVSPGQAGFTDVTADTLAALARLCGVQTAETRVLPRPPLSVVCGLTQVPSQPVDAHRRPAPTPSRGGSAPLS